MKSRQNPPRVDGAGYLERNGLSPILLVPVVMDDCLLTITELVFLLDDRLAVSGFALLDHRCPVAIAICQSFAFEFRSIRRQPQQWELNFGSLLIYAQHRSRETSVAPRIARLLSALRSLLLFCRKPASRDAVHCRLVFAERVLSNFLSGSTSGQVNYPHQIGTQMA